MTKGNSQWEEFVWFTVPERQEPVLAEKHGGEPRVGEAQARGRRGASPGKAWRKPLGRRGGSRRELRAHIFQCKHKAERINWKRSEAFNPKAYPQQYTSSCKAAPPKPPQRAPSNWEPSSQYKNLWGSFLLKLRQRLSFKLLVCSVFCLFIFLQPLSGVPRVSTKVA